MKHIASAVGLFTIVLILASFAYAQVTPGVPPWASTGGGPFDVLNLGSLNGHFDINVRSKAGRVTPFTYDITYDTSAWYPVSVNGVQTWQPVSAYGWTFPTISAGYLTNQIVATPTVPCNPPGNMNPLSFTVYAFWVYHDIKGGAHPTNVSNNSLPVNTGCTTVGYPATGTTTDGSLYTINVAAGSASATVTGADGKLYNLPINPTTTVSTTTDANGNQITSDSSGNITDTLGTVVLTASGISPKTFKYTAPNGSMATWTMNYTSYNIKTNFGCSGIAENTVNGVLLPTSLVLPDGTQYQFTYESTVNNTGYKTGRLASVTLPTGGSITYTYPTTNSGANNGINCADGSAPTSAAAGGNPSLTRTVTPGGTWKYYRTQVSGNHWQTKVTSPVDPTVGNDTVIDFQQDSSTSQYGSTHNFFETQRLEYQGSQSGGTLLRTTITCWNTANPTPANCPAASVSTLISRQTVFSYLPDTTSSSKVSETDTQYNQYSDPSFPSEVDSYDYGTGTVGSLIRKVNNYYALYGNAVQLTNSAVYDSGNTLRASTNFSYDGGTLATPSGTTPQWTNVSGGRGNLTLVSQQVSGTVTLYRKFTYFNTGMLNTVTDAGTTNSGGPNVTTFNYPNATSTCGNAFPVSVSEPLSLSRSFAWDCNGGAMTAVTDENGKTSSVYYIGTNFGKSADANYWRPYATADQLGNGTTISYPSNTATETALLFNGNNSVVDQRTKLDQFGRPILSQIKQGPALTSYDSTQTDYDNLGRASKAYIPFTSTADSPCSGTCPKTTTSYDAVYRPLTATDAGGGTLTFTYTKNDVLQVTGPAPTGENTKQRQYEYDGLGRLTSVCELTSTANGGGTCSQTTTQTGFWTKYTYDVLGNMIGVTQNAQAGSQQTRTYTFDMTSRMLTEQNPETGTITYTYDTADSTCGSYSSPGDLVEKRDAVGNVTCLKYDALHRSTQSTYPSGSYAARTPMKCYVYDAATVNGTVMGNTKTRLAEAYTTTASSCNKTSIVVDEGYSYSARGQITDAWESTPHSGGYYHPTAGYWESGALKTLWISTLPVITYGADGEGRTSTVSASTGQNPVTSTNYNTAGQVTGVTLGSGDSEAFSFDGSTARMTQYKYTINGSSEIGNLTWNPNASLKTLGITDPFNAGDAQTCNYVHDDLSRIASANCGTPWSQTFTYDAFGNVTKNGSISWIPGYNASTNRYTLAGTSYDLNGNLLADTFHSYTWDTEGNPATIDAIGLTYDAFARVVEQNQSGAYYQVVYTPLGSKLGLFNAQVIQQLYIPLPGGAKAEYLSWGLSHYRHADWLGSDRLESSTTRTILDDNAYAPFGEPYAQTGNGEISFTGQNKDTDWLQYDFLFRQYDPKQGRWLSPDPAGLGAVDPGNPQSWNRYAYSLNGPMALVDPLGLSPCDNSSDPNCRQGHGGVPCNGYFTPWGNGEACVEILMFGQCSPIFTNQGMWLGTPCNGIGTYGSQSASCPSWAPCPGGQGGGNSGNNGKPDPPKPPKPWKDKNRNCLNQINNTPDGKFYNFFSPLSMIPGIGPDPTASRVEDIGGGLAKFGVYSFFKAASTSMVRTPFGSMSGVVAETIHGVAKFAGTPVMGAAIAGQLSVHAGCAISSLF